MLSPSKELAYQLGALACLLIAAVFDVHSRRIPNALTGPSVIAALVFHSMLEGKAGFIQALAGAALGFCVTLVFFFMGGMGAGDVKLMALTGALVGLQRIGFVLLASALWGMVFALVLARLRGRLREVLGNVLLLSEHHRINGLVPHPELHVRSELGLRIPFAVPIALGCATVFLFTQAGGV